MPRQSGWPAHAPGRLRMRGRQAASHDERLADLAAEATEVQRFGPLMGAHRRQRLARFAPIIVLAMPLIASDAHIPVNVRVTVAVGAILVLAAAFLVPWRRLPRDAQGYPVLVPVVLIMGLTVHDGASYSPYYWLLLLPLIWLALYERRGILIAGLAIIATVWAIDFALNPSIQELPGLLPILLLCLLFPGLHQIGREARSSMLAQAERANRDPLTGLFNRRGLARAADANDRRASVEMGAIYLDVDHFKALNDQLGHAAGDDLLQQVGSRLAASVRIGDLVARVGGDEFLVIAEGDPVTIGRVRDRLDSRANGEPYQIDGTTIAMSVSVGVSTCQCPCDLAELVLDADRAMLAAKTSRHARRPAAEANPTSRRRSPAGSYRST